MLELLKSSLVILLWLQWSRTNASNCLNQVDVSLLNYSWVFQIWDLIFTVQSVSICKLGYDCRSCYNLCVSSFSVSSFSHFLTRPSFRQIVGSKKWWFIPPSQTPFIKPSINVNGFSAHTHTLVGKNGEQESPWMKKLERCVLSHFLVHLCRP